MASPDQVLTAAAERAEPYARIIACLAETGWCVEPDFLKQETVAGLRAECLERHDRGGFHVAGVGAGAARVVSELRGDAIQWLDPDDPRPLLRAYLDALEGLRQVVNRSLYLGLHELEAHFAVYPPGAFYRRHLDRFRDDDRRTLTAIVYLNADWRSGEGGQLRLWPDPAGLGEGVEIYPVGGTLVTFLSDRFWHEVLVATRPRLALTGWFKRR